MPFDSTLDPIAILAALGIATPVRVAPVQGGYDTALWRVESDSATYALRVYPPGRSASYQRELAAIEAARQAGLPVPIVYAAGYWQERPALVLSWCAGAPLWEAIQHQPWRLWSLGLAFGRTQAQLHKIAAPESLNQAHANWIGWAGSEDTHLHEALRRVASPTNMLLHLDYHPLNVLADQSGITAVIDWANAHAGDPRADVARTYTILMVEPFSPGRQPLHISIARQLLTRSWMRGYQAIAGPLTNMAAFYAWAGAVMIRDLGPRVANPESWWQPVHIQRIQDWTARWRARMTR